MKPNAGQFKEALGQDQWGYLLVDDTMHTNVPDVFPSGDVTSKAFRRITTAVSDGTIAAIQAAKELA